MIAKYFITNDKNIYILFKRHVVLKVNERNDCYTPCRFLANDSKLLNKEQNAVFGHNANKIAPFCFNGLKNCNNFFFFSHIQPQIFKRRHGLKK